jgi:hypothetical protein
MCGVHGRCIAGACACAPGFVGAGCGDPVLSPPQMDKSTTGDGGTIAMACGTRQSFRVAVATARAPRFAYAVPWDADLFGDGAATLHTHNTAAPLSPIEAETDPTRSKDANTKPDQSESPPHLTLSVVAPSVLPSDGCTPVLLAVSDDGMAFSSASVCVCFHAAAAEPSNVIARHAAACAVPREPWGQRAQPRYGVAAVALVVGLGGLGALRGRWYRRKRRYQRGRGVSSKCCVLCVMSLCTVSANLYGCPPFEYEARHKASKSKHSAHLIAYCRCCKPI